jgi:hypothetical protein
MSHLDLDGAVTETNRTSSGGSDGPDIDDEAAVALEPLDDTEDVSSDPKKIRKRKEKLAKLVTDGI